MDDDPQNDPIPSDPLVETLHEVIVDEARDPLERVRACATLLALAFPDVA